MEHWKTYPVYDNYEVSNLGNIRKIKKGSRPVTIYTEHNKNTGTKYYLISVQFKRDGKHRSSRKFLHKLVAETFLPNPDNKRSVHHKNRDTFDNRVENLEWCDRKNVFRVIAENKFQRISLESLNTEDEKWQIHPEFTDYAISNKGNIHNVTYDKRPIIRDEEYCRKKGVYKSVQVRKERKRYHKLVHRLVAETFIPNPDSKPTVNHIGSKYDNCTENLEWATYREQWDHEINLGKREGHGGKHTYLPDTEIEGEIWKPVFLFGDDSGYTVSDQGRIKNKKGNLMKGTRRGSCIVVSLYVDSKKRCRFVHSLVATAFILNPYNSAETRHKNGILNDNRAENLEWKIRKDLEDLEKNKNDLNL